MKNLSYPLLTLYFTTLLFIGCKPINRQSHQDYIWHNIEYDKSTYNYIWFINQYPLSIHFNEACSRIKEYELEYGYTGNCNLNYISCHIINEDSVLLDYRKISINDLDTFTYSILKENRYAKTIQIDQVKYKYSGSYFVVPITKPYYRVQKVIHRLKQGNQFYIEHLNRLLPHMSNRDKQLNQYLDHNIIPTQPYKFNTPPLPPKK